MSRKANRGKGRNKGGNQRGVRQPQRAQRRPAAPEPEQSLRSEHDKALKLAQEEDLNMPPAGEESVPERSGIKDFWQMAREARDVYEEAGMRYESRNQELDARSAKLDEQERATAARGEELDAQERSLAEKHTALDKREGDASERERSLLDRETAIRRREINAESGFAKERKEMLTQLDEAREASRSEFAAKWQAGEARLKEWEEALDERDDRLAGDQRELEKVKRRLGYEEADLEELRDDLDSRAGQLAAAIHEELEHRHRSLEAALEQARRDRDQYEETLRQRKEADRAFGQRTPEEVLGELDALRARNDELRADLAERPDADAAARLADLEDEREEWQAERAELRRENSEHRRRRRQADIDVAERESQREVIASLTSQRELLRKAHEELRAEIDDLHRRSEARTPFPACTGMDEDLELQSEPWLETGFLDLEVFVEGLRHRIADTAPEPLFYSLPDLRSFVGGLAMGRLILLQGISGTGKTSLPVAFARAVGTRAAEIKVQAGWRDPQDLIGHYNTFEKRFFETEFLKALYRAGTPQWKDTIQIVLLDEMNLSHPEQYFSDLLSTLELPEEDQRLEIMTHSVASAPALFAGGKLAVPPNVWFVGTANHDETTMDFADKTYDRSHVMEFPVRPEPFGVRRPPPRHTLSFGALQGAFDAAVRDHGEAAMMATNFLDRNLRDHLADGFQIGWGPRLKRQMDRYVPVVVAAGGTVGEATDHMLAMRLLRKLKNRHDNRPEHVEALKQRVRESWPTLDGESDPTKSIKLLDSELKWLGQDPENDG